MFRIVGTSFHGWYLVLAAVHGLNAFLLFRFLKLFMHQFNYSNVMFTATAAAFLFLFCPYNVEAVVWKACLHYLLTCMYFLMCLTFLLEFFINPSIRKCLAIHAVYLASLFTLELAFAMPFVLASFIILLWTHKRENNILKKSFLMIVLPQILILAMYFILTKVLIGQFIGHYGAEKHLNFDIELVFNNFWNYLCKHLLFAHFWTFKSKQFLYTSLLSNTWVLLILTSGLAGLFLFALRKWHSVNKQLKAAMVFFVMACFCLAPVVNLFFMWIGYYENDRYGYLFSAFLLPSLVFLLNSIPNKKLGYSILGIFALSNLFYFSLMMKICNEAGHLQKQLLDSFEYEAFTGDIYIAAIPDNYKGLYMFRDYTDNALAFRESLELFRGKSPKSRFIDLAQFNQERPSDGINLTRIDSLEYNIGFDQYGNWFWRNGVGMSSYSQPEFELLLKEGYYTLRFRENPGSSMFIYPVSGNWNSVVID